MILTLPFASTRQTVPEANRKLLTYHDSWAYWAREYGWEVVGAIQPSDFAEPSAQEVVSIIEQLKELKVQVIFGSEVFPSPVLEQISRETGARFEDQLSDDAPPGDVDAAEHTYVGMVVEDMRIMFSAASAETLTIPTTIPVENGFAR